MNRTSFVLRLSALLLVATTKAQEAVDPGAAMRSHGVVTTDGVVRGIGPDYSARFDVRGVEFTPALGAAADRPFPVRFTLESVRRGANDVFERAVDVAPVVAGEQVRYVHHADLAEVYDVRADGIEQSFVLATRPAGTGDLVVRGGITTELPLAAASDAGVRYERPDLGGVTFGAVTGVDANGATARGSIRVDADGTHVEWVLPAAFVENAAYPLVLDPLIGSAFTVANTSSIPDTQPSVAFDVTNSRYLVVWRVFVSASHSEIRGQRVTTGGTPIGGTILFSAIGSPDVRPAVANLNYSDRFLVGYATRSTITQPPFGTLTYDTMFVQAIDAGANVISAPVQIAGGLFSVKPTHVSIGGDSRGMFAFSQRALVAFRTETGSSNDIYVAFAYVPTGSNPGVTTPISIASSANRLGGPVVTAHCGSGAQWLVAFGQSILAPTGPMQRIVGQLVAADTPSVGAGVCGVPFTIVGSATDVDNPTVATSDGTRFGMAWQDNLAATVKVRAGLWLGTCGSGSMSLGAIGSPITTAGIADQPALGFAKDKFALAWRQRNAAGSSPRVMVKGLDPFGCTACGAEWTVDSTVAAPETPAIASRHDAGDAANDEALVVWSNGAIRARRFEARSDDVVTSMGGSCSISGFDDLATYDGDAVLGNANFQLAIAGSVSLPLVLIVGFSNLSAPCGGCTIVPSPDILFPATNPYTLAIPCDPLLVGQDIYTQWLILKPSTCPILPDFSFTNALRFTIGE